MERMDLLELLSGQNQIQKVIEMNQKTEKFGLVLSREDAKLLVERRKETLREQQRIEFGEGILPKLIFTFCDSSYIRQENYVETISRLQEIFYLNKNELMDELSDDELMDFMKTAFDGECEGSLEYLEETVLEEFTRSIRREENNYLERHYKIKEREKAEDEL